MTDEPSKPGERKNYEIHINRKPFSWGKQFITAEDVLGLVNEKPADYTAYIKVHKGDDIPVTEPVDLEDPKNHEFITIPNRSTEG